jgi:hypothetical protein
MQDWNVAGHVRFGGYHAPPVCPRIQVMKYDPREGNPKSRRVLRQNHPEARVS